MAQSESAIHAVGCGVVHVLFTQWLMPQSPSVMHPFVLHWPMMQGVPISQSLLALHAPPPGWATQVLSTQWPDAHSASVMQASCSDEQVLFRQTSPIAQSADVMQGCAR